MKANMSRGTSSFGCVATVVAYGSTDVTDIVPFSSHYQELYKRKDTEGIDQLPSRDWLR
jgi:hypothetical protein